jgi:hypothetical protein
MTKRKTSTEDDVAAWMPLWIGDYLADTMKLTRDLHGGYLLLLFAYWRNRGPLRDDDEDLAAIVKASEDEWIERIRPRLMPFFHVDGGHWRHDRADAELATAIAKRAAIVKRSRAGYEAMLASCGQPGGKPPTPPKPPRSSGRLSDRSSDGLSDRLNDRPSPSPSPNTETPPAGAHAPPPLPGGGDVPKTGEVPAKPKKSRRKDPNRFEVEFAVVWAAYPRHQGASRMDALRCYTARREAGATAEEILQGVLRYAEHCRLNRTETRHMKLPETFLGPMRHYLNDWSPIAAPAGSQAPARGPTRAERSADALRDVYAYGEDHEPTTDQPADETRPGHPADGRDGVIDVEARRVADG